MTLKVVLGGSFAVFAIGGTFWAGATYNRIEGIERQLVDISTRLSRISDIAVMQVKMEDMQEQINRLQNDQDRR